MKKYIQPFCFFILAMICQSAYSQKYKTIDDTARLNKEYVNVSNDIADLSAILTITQNNLPGYRSKAIAAETDAQHAAASSSKQATKATNGDIDDAKKAKRSANKAYDE